MIGGKGPLILDRVWKGNQGNIWGTHPLGGWAAPARFNWGFHNPEERIFYVTHDRGLVLKKIC
jgi:hypothetical protein